MNAFHPLTVRWFRDRVGSPTPLQAGAWPRIARGEHLLVTAPTGSGKTLTAFLWALDRLLSGAWEGGAVRVLYVSPLKALNNDIQVNLLGPLEELTRVFREAGEPIRPVRVLTRSGDTPQEDRRKMARQPPEVLITTPESLNILLTSPAGRAMLGGIRTVILDEIHAVLESKRGVHLITAVERLIPLAGEFQRLGLSATVRPAGLAARSLGGFRREEGPGGPLYIPREVGVVEAGEARQYQVTVSIPPEALEPRAGHSLWEPLGRRFRELALGHRSTLFFVNSRRLAEKVANLINQAGEEPLAYAHHGSLSRELRLEVERRLKAGELKAIVATNSLELGIDIGALDLVVLVQSPPSAASAVQRLGRAGHRVGEPSRGVFQPTHAWDVVEAAVLARAVEEGDLAPIRPVEAPLDVLAQVLVSLCCGQEWDLTELFDLVRTAHPYRDLSRRRFDLVVNMLTGRYGGARLPELRARLSLDRLSGRVTAAKGAPMAVYLSGGTIPDRGYFTLRQARTGARLGELDEEFVWEARTGDVFTLGSQNWRIERITAGEVLASPAGPGALAPPFWHGDRPGRDLTLSLALGEFLSEAEARLEDPAWRKELGTRCRLEDEAARLLVKYLKEQREHTGRPLPHRRHLLVEHTGTGPGGSPAHQTVLHIPWGGRVVRPLGLALEAAWRRKHGQGLTVFSGEDCLALLLPQEIPGEELLSLVTRAEMEGLLRESLEDSELFGARFREAAGRALVLTKRGFNRRTPLWVNRLKGSRLRDAVKGYPDFPLLLEAWRSCLLEDMDLEGLSMLLAELESGAMAWSETRTGSPSPFASLAAWRQINLYMYQTDGSPGRSSLSDDLIREAVFSGQNRPAIPPAALETLVPKLRRTAPGYAPAGGRELADWVKERLALPLPQWEELMAAMARDLGAETAARALQEASPFLARLAPPLAGAPLVAAREDLRRLGTAFWGGRTPPASDLETGTPIMDAAAPPDDDEARPEDLLWQWLSLLGPVEEDGAARDLGLDPADLAACLATLEEEGRVARGRLTPEAAGEEAAEAGVLESLLRLSRSLARPVLEPLPLSRLARFWAGWQGIVPPAAGPEDLDRRMERLTGHWAPAGAWEGDILPARCRGYRPEWLDRLLAGGELIWLGGPGQKVAFVFPGELDLLQTPGGEGSPSPAGKLFPDPLGRYDLGALARARGLPVTQAHRLVWEAVWRGEVLGQGLEALRRGLANRFQPPETPAASRPGGGGRGGRRALARWSGAAQLGSVWRLAPPPPAGEDPVEAGERDRDLAGLLLERYGVVFREVVEREGPPYSWAAVFRALRRMELAGDVAAGEFFRGAPGPQFASHQAVKSLLAPEREDGEAWWVGALDPAAPTGLGLAELGPDLPRRVPGAYLAYLGSRLAAVYLAGGKRAEFLLPPDHPGLAACLGPLDHLLSPLGPGGRSLEIKTINQEPAAGSPYLPLLSAAFQTVAGPGGVSLYPGV